MKKLFTLLFLVVFLKLQAQYKPSYYQIFDDGPGWPNSGWLASIGATYLWTPKQDSSQKIYSPQFTAGISNRSNPGIALEIGRFHIIPAGIICNNIDYSLGYKFFNYQERINGTFTPTDGTTPIDLLENAKRTSHEVNLNLNFNAVIQIGDYKWIQPTLGIHADYRVAQKFSFASDTANKGFNIPANNLNVQLHAKLAYGYKLNSELFIVPSLEVGLWNLNDLNQPKLKTPLFHKQYIPVILSVKFLLQRPASLKKCSIPDDLEDIDLSKAKRSKKKVRLF